MKQVIVVDESLHLPRGKLAAQVAHAALEAYLATEPAVRDRWENEGMAKIVLAASSGDELRLLAHRAGEAGLPFSIVADAGRTVVDRGTVTCLGIGPAFDEDIDRLTQGLKLVK